MPPHTTWMSHGCDATQRTQCSIYPQKRPGCGRHLDCLWGGWMEGFRAAVGSHFLTGWWSCIFMVWALCSLCVMPESLKFIKKASLREVHL